MKHITFLFFVFCLSFSYAQNESKQYINKELKNTENKITYTDTRLFAQCMFDIPNQSVIQELQNEMYDNPNIEMVRLDYHTQRALIITANIEELTKKDFISWFGEYASTVSCIQIGVYGVDIMQPYPFINCK